LSRLLEIETSTNTIARICFAVGEAAWSNYTRWMTLVWQGRVVEVLAQLEQHQSRLGVAPESIADDDPRERLRLVVRYLRNNCARIKCAEYRQQGLPTTTAWQDSCPIVPVRASYVGKLAAQAKPRSSYNP
jgi:hypothetical protein